MHSIRIKITAVTIAAILTSVLALGGLGVLSIGMESDRSSTEKMRLISENMQRKLDAYLDSLKQSVNMAIRIAGDSLDDLDIEYLGNSGTPEQVEALDAAMKKHCADVEHAFGSIANSTNGIVTYYYCINSDYGSNEHGFFWSKLDGDEFQKQPPLDSRELDRGDIDHTTWYYSPLKAGSAVWVGPYKAHFLGEQWTISYVAPIYHQGFVVGVLGMDILFDTMISQISSLRAYDSGFAFLMDRDGHVIYHPDMQSRGVPVSMSQSLDEELLRRRSSGDMMIRYIRNQKQWQLAFATLTDDHKVAVTAPVSEITASQRQLMLIILLVAAVILAVFTLAILFLMNALTKPLLRLTMASQKLLAGDYDVELDYEGRDEVGILTAAFRQMRNYLQLYISDLNSRAYKDAMTGVKNKGAFTASMARLNDTIRLGGQDKPPQFSIVTFDCNDLKQINDEYGHDCGDIYLQATCTMICKVFAHSPVFRMGGDEFSVILQRSDYNNREELLKTFDACAEERNATAEHPWQCINVAKGMAVYQPYADTSVEQVLHRADELMYEDKRRCKSSRGN